MNNEKLLITCDNAVYAGQIKLLLTEHNLAFRLHDETQDQRPGSCGPVEGLSFYVFEKDYERAKALVNEIEHERNSTHPWCPKCGCDDVEHIAARSLSVTKAVVLILMILIPGCYFGAPQEMFSHSILWLNIIMGCVLVSGIALCFLSNRKYNYKCHKCGRKFHHV